MKEWVQRFQPVQLYLMLALTIAFFLAELVVSHVTHALTLLMDSYHMLCNIIALTGCIITIKVGQDYKYYIEAYNSVYSLVEDYHQDMRLDNFIYLFNDGVTDTT